MDSQFKPFSVYMPNKLNFAFHFDMFLKYVIPTVYLFAFPGLYMHMVRQRQKFYGKLKSS